MLFHPIFRRLLIGISCGSTLLFAASPARATSLEPVDFSRLVKDADTIVIADVVATRSERVATATGTRIATFVTLQVRDTLKGAPRAELTLDLTGGTVDGQTLRIIGVPDFSVGQREFLFIKDNGSVVCPLVGFYHGRLRVEIDPSTGIEAVFRHDRRAVKSVSEVGRGGEKESSGNLAVSPSRGAMSAKDLATAVRALLPGAYHRPASADAALPDPTR